ncbi:hypothetical protein VTO42DRAFT_4005 [Malbranchea cinnamomea]
MASGKYIPPALRGKSGGDKQDPTWSTTYTLDEIAASFGYPKPGNGEENSAVDRPSEGGAPDTQPPPRKRSTLNASYDDQDKLAYIVLFHDAHPYWTSKREIFCKTNIDLLPDPPAPSLNDNEQSYPVFTQVRSFTRKTNQMVFSGYYRIDAIRYLEPQSKELIEYLITKFGDRPRDREAWQQSLSRRWAVITMACDESRKGELPQIQKFQTPVEQRTQRRVNEMLMELRRNS